MSEERKVTVGVAGEPARADVQADRIVAAFGIQMRRRWGVAYCPDGWRATCHYKNLCQHVTEAAFPDPATAVIEADRWFAAKFE